MIAKRWGVPARLPSTASSRVMSANFWRPSPVNWIVTIGLLPPMPGFEIVERASEMSRPTRPGLFWKTYQIRCWGPELPLRVDRPRSS